jgi:hypothetical protein
MPGNRALHLSIGAESHRYQHHTQLQYLSMPTLPLSQLTPRLTPTTTLGNQLPCLMRLHLGSAAPMVPCHTSAAVSALVLDVLEGSHHIWDATETAAEAGDGGHGAVIKEIVSTSSGGHYR